MTTNNHWTQPEVDAAVEDYFCMLRLDLSGERYNKTTHRRMLMAKLNERSDSSVELKHQNISAVLIEMGMPYIDGYKPRFNYQRSLLPAAVADYLKRHPEFQQLFRADVDALPSTPTVPDLLAVMEAPPKTRQSRSRRRFTTRPGSTTWSARRGTVRLARRASGSSSISSALA